MDVWEVGSALASLLGGREGGKEAGVGRWRGQTSVHSQQRPQPTSGQRWSWDELQSCLHWMRGQA